MNFFDWICGQEWRLVLAEADAYSAARNQFNAILSNKFQMQRDWFGLAMQIAKNAVRGQDETTVASDAISHLLRDPRGEQEIADILSDPDTANKENRLIAYFKQAMFMRVRRFADSFKSRATPISVMDKDDKSAIYQQADTSDGPTVSRDLESLKRMVVLELQRMAVEARARKETKMANRLALAAKVAPERMKHAPDMVTMDELKGMFPDIGHAQMYGIIQDIQAAFTRVAHQQGMGSVTGRINQYRQAN